MSKSKYLHLFGYFCYCCLFQRLESHLPESSYLVISLHLIKHALFWNLSYTITTVKLTHSTFLTCCSGRTSLGTSSRVCPFSTWMPIERMWKLEWPFTLSLSRRFFPFFGNLLTRSDICGMFVSWQSLPIVWLFF